jgi:hypothetical protein
MKFIVLHSFLCSSHWSGEGIRPEGVFDDCYCFGRASDGFNVDDPEEFNIELDRRYPDHLFNGSCMVGDTVWCFGDAAFRDSENPC